jgi:hypothetical protein
VIGNFAPPEDLNELAADATSATQEFHVVQEIELNRRILSSTTEPASEKATPSAGSHTS